jgi:pectinesterase inhibitor-like protein
MRTNFSLLVAAAVAAASFASMCRPAQAVTTVIAPLTKMATVSGTCQAAHDAYSRVNATFCIAHLRKEPWAIDADMAGLADAAAAAGVRNADTARAEVATALRRHDEGNEQVYDPLCRGALERCDKLYGIVCEKFDVARGAIGEGRYGDIERELSSVPWLGHACDARLALARRGRAGASPFLPYGEDNTQITFLTLAITGLISQ